VYKYRLNVWWREEDQAWLVEVPELPRAMADGASPEKAVAHVQVIIEEWIVAAQETCRAVPEPEMLTTGKS
jgi:predicted RNase H-like HicB family nuclease